MVADITRGICYRGGLWYLARQTPCNVEHKTLKVSLNTVKGGGGGGGGGGRGGNMQDQDVMLKSCVVVVVVVVVSSSSACRTSVFLPT